MTYPIEVRQQAIELRLSGHTYREIEEKLGVSDASVHNWTSDQRSQASLARQQRVFDAHQEIVLEAQKEVLGRLPNMEDKDAIRTLNVASIANQGAIRLLQDQSKANSLIDAIRQALRAKSPDELRIALDGVTETPAIADSPQK